VLALIGIGLLVPDLERNQATGLRGELHAFRHPQVWLSKAITILGYGGMFGAFTYIAFTLTEVSGFAASSVPWLLILFGVGLLVGNTLGAKAADRALTPALVTILALLTVVLVVFALTAHSKAMTVIALFLMGAFGFATVPGLQMRIMNYASGAPTLASGANIAAFNIGNALGAWLGGLTIAAGLGFTSPIWTGAIVTAFGLVVLVGADVLDRTRTTARSDAASAVPATS
jgi:MFS transporter, DHA1 family, inner membrane transport protein